VDLDAIEARLAKATPGPWIGYTVVPGEKGQERPPSGCCVDSNATDAALVRAGRSFDGDGRVYDNCIAEEVRLAADAELIAHAPADLAALAAEVRALRGRVAELEAAASDKAAGMGK
jgi:hypothetical protein